MAAEAEGLGVGISAIMLWGFARSLKCNVSAAQQPDRQDEGMEQIRVSVFAGPSAAPEIRSVPWPAIPKKAGLIKIGACGVCGTDLHILKGHWPKQLPWPFTLGHELGGVLVEVGSEFTEDFMSKPTGRSLFATDFGGGSSCGVETRAAEAGEVSVAHATPGATALQGRGGSACQQDGARGLGVAGQGRHLLSGAHACHYGYGGSLIGSRAMGE
jgi:hypothetical protein